MAAGLCGLRILLLWAGIVSLANCQAAPTRAGECPSHIRCGSDQKTFCIKPAYDDICTDLTKTFPSKDCQNSFNISRSIDVEFLDSFELNLTAPTGLPAKIEPKLPRSCKNLTVDFTCLEAGGSIHQSNPQNLSDLKPFTDYSCTGQVKNGTVTVKNTTALKIRIDCDFTLKFREVPPTNTSIKLSWNTTSTKCGAVLPQLDKLSYDCSCSQHRHGHKQSSKPFAADLHGSGGTCDVRGLKPYTEYHCEVQTKYDGDVKLTEKNYVERKTAVGKPADITSLSVETQEHNEISVSCEHGKLNGPRKYFDATLSNGGTEKEFTRDTCKFKFTDLSYLTEYTVEVKVCNGHFCSNPMKKSTQTSYGIARPIIFVFTFLILTVALVVALYKIYILRRRTSRGEMLELNAIYANVPQRDDTR